jgi:hypothetical protein
MQVGRERTLDTNPQSPIGHVDRWLPSHGRSVPAPGGTDKRGKPQAEIISLTVLTCFTLSRNQNEISSV